LVHVVYEGINTRNGKDLLYTKKNKTNETIPVIICCHSAEHPSHVDEEPAFHLADLLPPIFGRIVQKLVRTDYVEVTMGAATSSTRNLC
jgi:hypothetical protein